MRIKNPDGSFRFTDPFAGIDGTYHVAKGIRTAENSLHLDIFFPESILKLGAILDLNDSSKMLGYREAGRAKTAEGQVARLGVEGR